MSNYVSPYIIEAARRISESRSAAPSLEVSERREQLETQMRAEGAPEAMIERLATDDTAAKMLDYDRKVVDLIANMFGPR